jgi:hypothetical protein
VFVDHVFRVDRRWDAYCPQLSNPLLRLPLAHTPTLTHTTLLYSTLSTLPYTLQHPLVPPTCPTPPNCPLQAQFSGAKHLNYVASSQSMRDLSSKQAYNQHGQTGGNNNTRSSSSSDHNLLYPPAFLSPTASEGGRHSWGTRRPGGLRRERPPPWSVIQAVGDRGMLGAMRRERRRDEEHREKLETSMSLEHQQWERQQWEQETRREMGREMGQGVGQSKSLGGLRGRLRGLRGGERGTPSLNGPLNGPLNVNGPSSPSSPSSPMRDSARTLGSTIGSRLGFEGYGEEEAGGVDGADGGGSGGGGGGVERKRSSRWLGVLQSRGSKKKEQGNTATANVRGGAGARKAGAEDAESDVGRRRSGRGGKDKNTTPSIPSTPPLASRPPSNMPATITRNTLQGGAGLADVMEDLVVRRTRQLGIGYGAGGGEGGEGGEGGGKTDFYSESGAGTRKEEGKERGERVNVYMRVDMRVEWYGLLVLITNTDHFSCPVLRPSHHTLCIPSFLVPNLGPCAPPPVCVFVCPVCVVVCVVVCSGFWGHSTVQGPCRAVRTTDSKDHVQLIIHLYTNVYRRKKETEGEGRRRARERVETGVVVGWL